MSLAPKIKDAACSCNRKPANHQITNASPLPMPYDGECQGQVTAGVVPLQLHVPVAGIVLGNGGEVARRNRSPHEEPGMRCAGSLSAQFDQIVE